MSSVVNLRTLLIVGYFISMVTCFPSIKRLPVCTSHNTLCDVSFNIKGSNFMFGAMKYQSGSPICACPGSNTCPNSNTANDKSRVLKYQEMASADFSITTNLAYCNQQTVPTRKCDVNEIVMTLRGVGPVIMELVGDVKCICRGSGAVTLYRTVADGIFSIRQYKCGQTECNINLSQRPVCERITKSAYEDGLQSVFPCQCPAVSKCHIDPSRIPTQAGQTSEFYCERRQSY